MRCLVLTLYFSILLSCSTLAQGSVPLGQWREYLPWNNALRVQTDQRQLFTATPFGLFVYDLSDQDFTRYSRVQGLAEVRLRTMASSIDGGWIALGYANANMDIIHEGRIRNLPDLLQSSNQADKTLRDMDWESTTLLVSCGLGIVVVDAEKMVVRDTWLPGNNGDFVKVNGFQRVGNQYLAATEFGLFEAPVNAAQLADFRNWLPAAGGGLLPKEVSNVKSFYGKAVALQRDSLFWRISGRWELLFAADLPVTGIDSANGRLFVCQSNGNRGRIQEILSDGSPGSIWERQAISVPRQVCFADGSYWIADENNGLLKWDGLTEERVFPNSPINTASGEFIIHRDTLWSAAGSVNENWNYTFNPNGLYSLANDTWSNINLYVYPQIDSLFDLISLAADPVDGTIYAGSFGGGLLEIRGGRPARIYKQGSGLQEAIGDPGSYRVAGLAMDKNRHLWIANYGAPQNLVLRKPDGSWRAFTIPFLHTENAVAQILIDNGNRKWIQSPKANGVFVLDDGGTPDQLSDDRWRYLRAGKGNGNLPSPEVWCLAMDLNGFIWIGTEKGVAIVTCPDEVLSSNTCEAVIPVVSEAGVTGFLFGDEQVRAIAVDGANRKWVGTRNGLWLISADGQEILGRYTETNSPLLSNIINEIIIHPRTGEVFIATFNGICSFRGTATQGEPEHGDLLVFPNPVPPGYTGTIAIRGLADQAWVKIVEPDGRLVFQGRALGGQFVWNGKDYKGGQVSSGVYLVLAADQTNREQVVTRIFFVR